MVTDIDDPIAAQLQHRLTSLALFEPLSADPREIAHHRDHDLANLIESRFGEVRDPASLDERSRRAWTERAVLPGELSAPGELGPAYWIRDGERRIGTIAWWMHRRDELGRLNVVSLYIAPAHRRRGHARRALFALRDAARAVGLREVRLEASWYAQPALRFYCALGMWVRLWKHDIMFAFMPGLPSWRMELTDDVAHFFLVGDERPLVIAARRGDALVWHEQPRLHAASEKHLKAVAPGTFSVALAIEGWPLVRSPSRWQRQLALGSSDGGGPEGLAFRIRQLDAWAERHRWPVKTPLPR